MKTGQVIGVALLVTLTTTTLLALRAGADNLSADSPSHKEQAEGRLLDVRQVISDRTGYTTDVTLDGRSALIVTEAFGRSTNENPSRLVIRDMLTKATTTLVTGRAPCSRPAAVFSADARHVAYLWTGPNVPCTPTVLNVIGTSPGAAPRTLVTGGGIIPHAWSRDGKSILVLIHGPGASIKDPTSIGWISVADGAIRTIKILEPWRSGADALPRLSPDGASIAYSAFAREGSTDRYVYVIDANGQKERAVAKMAGSNTLPAWTPDSAHIVFVNTQSGRSDLYAVSVGEGHSTEPVRLRADFAGEPLRVARSGDLFYQQFDAGSDEMIVEIRSDGARIVQAFPGTGGTWAKGNTLAFFRTSPQGGNLVFRSVDTSQERSYPHEGLSFAPPRWLSDDSGVIVYVAANADGGRPGSFYRVNAQTGEFTWLFAKDTQDHVRWLVGVLSPDDRTFYLAARVRAQAAWTRIVGVDLATGVERSVAMLREPGLTDIRGLAISPDGTTLAIYAGDGRIMTVQTNGRDYRELRGPSAGTELRGAGAGSGWPDVLKWTPDGRAILFAARDGAAPAAWRMMQISAAGGPVEVDGPDSSKPNSSVPLPRTAGGSVTTIDLSRDGSHIALALRTAPTNDVWTLANVASALGSVRR